MVGTSGQACAEYVATAVRELQSFDVKFRDKRDPQAAVAPASRRGRVRCSRGRSSTTARMNAAPWRVEIEFASGDTVIFQVQFENRKTMPAELSFELEFKPTGDVD